MADAISAILLSASLVYCTVKHYTGVEESCWDPVGVLYSALGGGIL